MPNQASDAALAAAIASAATSGRKKSRGRVASRANGEERHGVLDGRHGAGDGRRMVLLGVHDRLGDRLPGRGRREQRAADAPARAGRS